MQFTVRSLGGKLVAFATLTLLLCMVLFALLSWGLLRFYAEQAAKSDAQAHLALLKRAYQAHTTSFVHNMDMVAGDPNVVRLVAQPSTPAIHDQLHDVLTPPFLRHRLTTLLLVAQDHHLLAQIGDDDSGATQVVALVDRALQKGMMVAVRQIALSDASQRSNDARWVLSVVLPLHTDQLKARYVLLASETVDDYFAQDLLQSTNTHVILCLAEHIEGEAGSAIKSRISAQHMPDNAICTGSAAPFIVNVGQRYLMLASTVDAPYQTSDSPSLAVVAVEPLFGIDARNPRMLFIILGMGLFIFALGVSIYTLCAWRLLIYPLRQLQVHMHALLADNTSQQVKLPDTDEVSMLAWSFNLLSESLESEGQALMEEMGKLLVMSDALIATLNLEHLLGEIVSRLTSLMRAKHTSLLLYGRDMLTPWAVAQWDDTARQAESSSENDQALLPPHASDTQSSSYARRSYGSVTVYVDPDGDITLAVTTKMAAISTLRKNPASGKRNAIRPVRATKLAQIEQPRRGRRTRIPREALRDLDISLARMAIQREKIIYGEDIQAIYQQRQDSWAQLALGYDYRSIIAVPLMIQEQAIGAFILYDDQPHQMSSRDTFLLSTAANQASMAIQNALLFAEVKEKNAALERANHLKSQFLANVTHELRTPLHSIISYGALILEGFVEGELTQEQEEHIQFIVRRAEDLSHLVDDMLDLSKIEADRIEVKLEPLELRACLTEVVNQLKPMANNKGLSLTLEITDRIPKVMADGHRIRQVVINLVSNALKFTEKGGVTIRCTLMNGAEMVVISVTDTGIGISPAALGYIFEAFRQADGSTTRRFGGTGLGLTIAKKLIELQGGDVAVESVPGEGSTFSLTLPVVPSLKTNV